MVKTLHWSISKIGWCISTQVQSEPKHMSWKVRCLKKGCTVHLEECTHRLDFPLPLAVLHAEVEVLVPVVQVVLQLLHPVLQVLDHPLRLLLGLQVVQGRDHLILRPEAALTTVILQSIQQVLTWET